MSNIQFQKRSFTYMFYFLLVEERFSSFLINDTMLNESEVTLRVDVISNIFWKGQLSE